MKKVALLLAIFLISLPLADEMKEKMVLTRKDFIELKVSSYLSGYKKFDTSVLSIGNTISVSIYLFPEEDRKYAEVLLKKWKEQIKMMMDQYEWGKKLEVRTQIYPVDKRL